MAARNIISWIIASALIAGAGPALSAGADDLHCAGVQPGVTFEFQGHTLLETPDMNSWRWL